MNKNCSHDVLGVTSCQNETLRLMFRIGKTLEILKKRTLNKNRSALFVDDLDIEKSQILSHSIRSRFNQDIVADFSRF
jgi:hypothetical protein